MTASKNYRKVISVGIQYNPTCSLFALTSNELPGLLLAGKEPLKLWEDVPAVIKAMYKTAYDMDVEVSMDLPFRPETPIGTFAPFPQASLAHVEPRVN